MTDENTSIENMSEQQKTEIEAAALKLTSIIVCLFGFMANLNPIITSLLLLVLWLQEAIWKTFQGRTEQRLLVLEKAYQTGHETNNETQPLQFYRHWTETRPGTTKLIAEYLGNAIRPTIAYPYVALLPLSFIADCL